MYSSRNNFHLNILKLCSVQHVFINLFSNIFNKTQTFNLLNQIVDIDYYIFIQCISVFLIQVITDDFLFRFEYSFDSRSPALLIFF